MLYRKIADVIEKHLRSGTDKILLVDGARQVGKTYIIRHVGQKLYENFIELNMIEDSVGERLFADIKTVDDFYLQVSMLAGDKMKERENTLIFIDEIQAYPHLLTLLKFLQQANRFTYIASGSLLGIYDMIPSNMENKKKRVVAQSIENKRGKTFSDYSDEFEYLISAGVALSVQAISNPVFPLIESGAKNLLKLYLNDVGILTGILYGNNIRAILDDVKSINLGSVYECVVASELVAHGNTLYYYDNRSRGEVDYLIDDYDSLSAVPIEVKSGKDYTVHSALRGFVSNGDYHVEKAFVLSNERKIAASGKITYLPIYFVMFFGSNTQSGATIE